jgi:hypothetical protein
MIFGFFISMLMLFPFLGTGLVDPDLLPGIWICALYFLVRIIWLAA